MGIISKKICEENIRKVMKEENYQEAEIILDRVSKPMIYYGIVDGSHEILQQELVDYYRGEGRRRVKGNSFWGINCIFRYSF